MLPVFVTFIVYSTTSPAFTFFPLSIAFFIASGTSAALPFPTPTCPFSSPTTTTALNLKVLPPLTTLATLLIATTFSSSSSSFAFSTFTSNPSFTSIPLAL